MINAYNAKQYCCEPIELIENYNEAVADTTQMWDCHHRGEVLPCGVYSKAILEKFNLYWHCPACELIFVTKSQHNKIHKADRAKGGKIGGKIGGRNGSREQHAKAGRIGGRIGGKIGGKNGGAIVGKMPWWNNGVINTKANTCPGEGWVLGRLKRRRH